MTHDLTSIYNTGNVCIADVVDTGDGCSDTELIRYQTYFIRNLSDTELIRYLTYQIVELFATVFFFF
jgi:hypothetical protein